MKRSKLLTLIAFVVMAAMLLSGCGAKAYDSAMPEDNYADSKPSYSYTDSKSDPGADAPMEMAPADDAYAETDSEYAGGVTTQGSLSASSGVTANLGEKMIYTAWTEIQTTEFDNTLAELEKMIAENGAFIQTSNISGKSYQQSYYGTSSRWASYTVRVPAENFRTMKGELDRLGYVTYINEDAQNITAQYTDVESRLKALRTEESRLLELLAKAETVEDIITVESRLSDVRYEIESSTATLRNWDNQVNYSTLNLDISEVAEIKEYKPVTRTYGQRIRDAFVGSMEDFWDGLKDFGVGIAGSIPTLVILAAIVLIVIFGGRRVVRKAKAKRAAKKAEKYAAKAASEEIDKN